MPWSSDNNDDPSGMGRYLQQQREKLAAREAQAQQQLGAQYQATMQRITPHVRAWADAYSRELARVRAETGDPAAQVSEAWMREHLDGALGKKLTRFVQAEVNRFADEAQKAARDAAKAAADLGADGAQALMAQALSPVANLLASKGMTPGDLVNAIQGDALDGLESNWLSEAGQEQLANIWWKFGDQASLQLYQLLHDALRSGDNPNAWAPAIRNIFAQASGSPTQDALLASRAITQAWEGQMARYLSQARSVARTEMLGAYRFAQLANYRANSDIIKGWTWSAAVGACPVCTDLDGTFHTLDESMDGCHVNCRCSPVPTTSSWADILGPLGIDTGDIPETSFQPQLGSNWFAQQSADYQRGVLGPAAFNAYQAGALRLDDLVGQTADGQYYQKSMKSLGLDANAWLGKGPNAGEAVRIELPGGGFTYVTAGPQIDLEPEFNLAGRAEGWAGIDTAMQGMRGDADTRTAWDIERDAAIARAVASLRPGQTAAEMRTEWDIQRDAAIARAEAAGQSSASVRSAWDMQRDAAIARALGQEPPDVAFAALSAPGGGGEVATYALTPDDHAFLARLDANLPAGGITTAEDAQALGRHIAGRIHSDPEVARLERFTKEAADIRTRLPGNVTEEERAWFAGGNSDLAIQALRAHDSLNPFEVAAHYQAAYQARVRAYLAAFRDVGGVELRVADGADALVAERLGAAREMLPSDWLEASNDLGEMRLIKSSERSSEGWFQANANGDGMLALRYLKGSDAANLESAALHEIAHRMEQVIPQLSDIEGEFYAARTGDEAFVALTNGIKQRTKLDDWLDEYLGREPLFIQRPAFQLADGSYRYATQSYELFSMGAEMALAPGASADIFALHADSDYEALVLGSLFGVQAPYAEVTSAAEAAEAATETTETAAQGGAVAFAAKAAGTALSDAERQAVRDAAAAGDLPKSYGRYTTVEQLTKTAKGAKWYAARAASAATDGADDEAIVATLSPAARLAQVRTQVDDAMAQREALYGQQHDLAKQRNDLLNEQNRIKQNPQDALQMAEYRAKVEMYRASLDQSDPEVRQYLKDSAANIQARKDSAAALAEQRRLQGLMDTLSIQGNQGGDEYAQAKSDYDAATKAYEKAHKAALKSWDALWTKSRSVYKPELDSMAGFDANMRALGVTFSPAEIASNHYVVAARAYQATLDNRIAEVNAQLQALNQPISAINAQIDTHLASLKEMGATLGTETDALDTMQPFSGVLDLPEGHQPPNALMNKLDYKMHEPRAVTKRRIIDDINTRLKDNPDWQDYVDRMPLPDRLGVYHDYIDWHADPADSKSAALVADWIKRWGVGYGPGSPQWVAMQMAARDEFGLDAVIHTAAANAPAGERFYAENGAALRALMRSMYDNTQQWFAENGITEIEVYRGFGWAENAESVPADINWGPKDAPNYGVADMELNPFQSFSADINISQGTGAGNGFAGGGFGGGKNYSLLIGAKVPVARVLGTAQTGFGAKLESEIVVMGRATDTVAYRAGTDVESALIQQAEEQSIGDGAMLYSLADGTQMSVVANADNTYTVTLLGGRKLSPRWGSKPIVPGSTMSVPAKTGLNLKVGSSKTYKTVADVNKLLRAARIANVYAPPGVGG